MSCRLSSCARLVGRCDIEWPEFSGDRTGDSAWTSAWSKASCLLVLAGLLLLAAAPRAGAQTPEDALLRASNAQGDDEFGYSVAVDGDRAVVGAWDEDGPSNNKGGAGAAYVFERGENGAWQQVKVLRASNAETGDEFGISVAIDGDRAVVGAQWEDGPSNSNDDAGAAYVFERTSSGWNQNEDKILRASNAETNDDFGSSVAIDGDRAVVGAREEDGPSNNKDDAGAAYVFERTSSGWNQNEDKILRASNAEGSDRFGSSVAIDGDRAVVGAWREDGPSDNKDDAGAAYLYISEAPTASTDAPSPTSATTADFSGAVNPGGAETDVTVQYREAGASSFTSVPAAESPVTGITDQSVRASASGLEPATEYEVKVTASNAEGSDEGSLSTFTTPAAAPTASTGNLTPTSRTAAGLSGTVNPGGAETDVTFQYREAGASSFTSVPAAESPLTGTSDQPVSASASGLTSGTEYEVEVTASNSEGSDESSLSTVRLPPGTVTATVDRAFGDASGPDDYRLVALPGEVDKNLSASVSGESGRAWQAYRDDGSGSNFLQRFDGSDTFTFEPGGGFWLTATENWTSGLEVSSVPLQNGTTEIDLRDGWNIISNPLSKDVSWADVKSANGGSLAPLWAFDGTFSKASTFGSATAGTAYYFRNDQNLSPLTIPYPSAAGSKSAQKQVASSEDAPGGALTLTAIPAGGDGPRSTIHVGTDESADLGLDSTDMVGPPSRFETVSLRSVAPTTGKKAGAEDGSPKRTRTLMTDLRPPVRESEGRTFSLRLRDRVDGPVVLSAHNADDLGRSVALIRPEAGKTYDLTETKSLRITPAETSGAEPLTLAAGSEAYVEKAATDALPSEVTLTAYPNPIRESGTLEYTLPEATEVTLRLYDTLGRQVRTLATGRRDAGRHPIELSGAGLSSGLYIGRLQAHGQTLTQKITIVR